MMIQDYLANCDHLCMCVCLCAAGSPFKLCFASLLMIDDDDYDDISV